MGTNFYKIIPVKKSIKDALKDKIDKEDFYVDKYGDVKFNNLDDLDIEPNEIHIGKRSAGWKFLIDYNDWKYFHKSEQSITDWILDKSDNSIIKDEYGHIISHDQMLKEIMETYDIPWLDGKERWDAYTYNLEHPSCYNGIADEMYVGKYRVSIRGHFS